MNTAAKKDCPMCSRPTAVSELVLSFQLIVCKRCAASMEADHKEDGIEALADDAEQAFWQALVDARPNISKGDMDPAASERFSKACREAVRVWLESNR